MNEIGKKLIDKLCQIILAAGLDRGKGSHRLEKYLNLDGFLEKSLKIKSTLKSTGKPLKSLEKSLNSTISVRLSTVDRDLNHYKIVMPLFCAAYAAPNEGTTIFYLFSNTNFSIVSVKHF